MKKTVPFKKDLYFKDNIFEITSISLEHSLHTEENNQIVGEFLISGEYKITQQSINVDKFEFKIPFFITVDEKYDTKNVNVDINDFYYEIVNSNVLSVNIEVLLDKLEEIEVEEIDLRNNEIKSISLNIDDLFENDDNEVIEKVDNQIMVKEEKIMIDESEFVTYKIYIVKENDTIESIMNNYKKTREELGLYNNLDMFNIGEKLIIPTND